MEENLLYFEWICGYFLVCHLHTVQTVAPHDSPTNSVKTSKSKSGLFYLSCWTVCPQSKDEADSLEMKSLCRPPRYILNWVIQLWQHDITKAASSDCKSLLFKKVYYLFLSIFCQCSQHLPETASACAILDLVPVAGSLVTRALELARVSLQSFLD